jgi:hypothetical protein
MIIKSEEQSLITIKIELLQHDTMATSIWPKPVLLHDLLVVDGVADVNVGLVWHVVHGRVQVQHIRCLLRLVQVCIEPLQQTGFARASHS